MNNPSNHWNQKHLVQNEMFRVPLVIPVLIAVLLAVHAALWWLGPIWQTVAMYGFSFIPARLGGGIVIPRPAGSEIWSFVTYALLHADAFHLASNCLWLLVFSTPVARRLGTLRYLLLIVLTCIAGATAMLASHWGQVVLVIGISGAVSGMLGAAIPIMNARGFSPQLSTPHQYRALQVLPLAQLLRQPRAISFALMFLGLTLLSGTSRFLTGAALLEEQPIAWEAHLGGFVAGLLLFYLFDRKAVSQSQ